MSGNIILIMYLFAFYSICNLSLITESADSNRDETDLFSMRIITQSFPELLFNLYAFIETSIIVRKKIKAYVQIQSK